MNREEFEELQEVTNAGVVREKSKLKARVFAIIENDAKTLDEIMEDQEVQTIIGEYESIYKTKGRAAIKTYLGNRKKVDRRQKDGKIYYIMKEE